MTLKSYQRYASQVRKDGLNPTDPATGFHLHLPMDVKITRPVSPDSFILAPDFNKPGKAVRTEAIRLLDVNCGGIEFSVVVHLHKDELRLTTSDNVTGMAMPVLAYLEKGNPVNNILVGALHFIHAKGITQGRFLAIREAGYARYKTSIEKKP